MAVMWGRHYCYLFQPRGPQKVTLLCSFSQDVKNRRNPRLVPYILLDERTKKSNKDSLREAVRTLLGYGYNLEAPDQDHGKDPLLYISDFFIYFYYLRHFQG